MDTEKVFLIDIIKNNPQTKTLAIVIDFQVMKSVPKNNNDMKVHDIIVVPSKDKHEIWKQVWKVLIN